MSKKVLSIYCLKKWAGILMFLAPLVFYSCGRTPETEPSSSFSFSLSCGPEDQKWSYAFVRSAQEYDSLTVQIDKNFLPEEKRIIEESVAEWNLKLQNLPNATGKIVSIGTEEVAHEAILNEFQNCENSEHPSVIPVIDVSEIEENQFSFSPYELGKTSICYELKKSKFSKKKKTAVEQANSVRFKSSSIYIPMFRIMEVKRKGVLMHEIGHALGLRHSCSLGTDDKGLGIECKDLKGKKHPYVLALMYPDIGRGISNEVLSDSCKKIEFDKVCDKPDEMSDQEFACCFHLKGYLNKNDIERTACLLGVKPGDENLEIKYY